MSISKESPSVVGTYEYVLEDLEGLCIYTETHVIWLLSKKGRKSFQGEQPSDAEKAGAFDSSFADVCTYKFVGPSRITGRRLFSTNPTLVGKELIWEYEFEGELCKYWVLQSDGSRGPMGTTRRISK